MTPIEDLRPGRPVSLVEYHAGTPLQWGEIACPVTMPWADKPHVCVVIRAYLADERVTLSLGTM